jgi:RING finger protein 170
MCRSQVAFLLPLFSMAAEKRRSNANNQLFELIDAYNRRFSGLPRSLWDQLQEIPLLLRHLLNELFTFNNMEIWFRLRFGFLFLISLMYFLSPLDIIPEALFGLLGYLDDFLVLIIMALYICSIYRQVIFQRAS